MVPPLRFTYILLEQIVIPVGEVDGVHPEQQHEDNDEAVLGSELWLRDSSLVERREGGYKARIHMAWVVISSHDRAS